MDKKKIGHFLKTRREVLGIKAEEMARKIGCNRTTVLRQENGTSAIRSTKVRAIAAAYEIDAQELADLCCFSIDESLGYRPEYLDVTATVEDFEFLITVARDLQKPMNIQLIRELLKCRKQQG